MVARSVEASRSNPFSVVVVAALLSLGIAAFCAFLVLGAYAPDFRGDPGGGPSALSKSAVGFAGIVDLLRSLDAPVAIRRVSTDRDHPALLVLTPPAGAAPTAVEALLGKAETTLIVLPKWRVERDEDHPGWVHRLGLVDQRRVTAMLAAAGDLSRRNGAQAVVLHGAEIMEKVSALRLGRIDQLQTIAATDDWTPILLDDAGRAVLAQWSSSPDGATYVLADPDLLDTQGLKDAAAARAAVAILDGLREGAPVTFDVTLNGLGRDRSLLRLMFEPPLVAATLCGLASALLILIMAFHRFGPPAAVERILDFGKRALADNSAALIALARRETAMAMPYAELTRGLVIREIGAPARLDRARMDRFLDTVAASRGLSDSFTGLAADAAEVGDRAALLALARRLHRWSRGLRRGHR